MSKTYSEVQQSFWQQDKTARRDARHPVVAWIYRRQAQKLKEQLTGTVASILDCGCGNGFFQTHLTDVFGVECVGVDFSAPMLHENRNPLKVTGSVFRLPFDDDSFDLVTCSMLLHHLTAAEQQSAIREMARVARKFVFVAEPNRNNPANFLFGLVRREERGLLNFTKTYLRQLCRTSGLTVRAVYVDTLLVPNMMPVWMLRPMSIVEQSVVSGWIGFNCNGVCEKQGQA